MPKGELRTDEIVKHALSHGKDVFVPFTKIPEQPDAMKMLQLKSLEDFESLRPNAWKIPEHETAEGIQEGALSDLLSFKSLCHNEFYSGTALDPDNDGLDLIVLPGLAFDRTRTRLGHGKGYYDRYLALVELWTKTRGVPMPATGASTLSRKGGSSRFGWLADKQRVYPVALALDEQIREAALPSDATDRKPDVVVHSSGLIAAESQ